MKPKNPWLLTTYFSEAEPATGKKAQPGIHLPFWFWGCEAFRKSAAPNQGSKKLPKKDDKALPETPSADEQVQRILVDTPDMPAAAMLNKLKAEGIELVDKKESVSATSHPGIQRESSRIPLRARFLESWRDDGVGPTRFRVALIQEGLGNLRDAFYYTRGALETGIQAFEGKKCFADHPSRSEEADRPERSVRDIVGHFENVHLEERDDGAAMLCADLVMMPDPSFEWARALVRHALEYSKKYADQEFIGLSINASGDAEARSIDEFLREGDIPSGAKPKLIQAKEEGVDQVRVVTAIGDAVSTDIVTEPGARGKVLEMLETERKESMKQVKHAEDEAKKKVLPEAEVKHAEEEAKQAEAEDEGEGEQEKPEGEEDHADEEQDRQLILDMIKKHMGEACEGIEGEGEKAAHEAYLAHREMGKTHEEAVKHAAEAMKLAKHMAAKIEAKQAEAEGEAESEVESEGEAKHAESMVKLTARIAFLERELKKRELAEFLDKKLAESKLGRAETDKLRKLIGTPKSEAEILKTIGTFKEAFDMGRGGSESAKPSFASLFVTGTEKAETTNGKAKVSFVDCVKL